MCGVVGIVGHKAVNQQIYDASGGVIRVPYRAESYVLMSAGKDGLFGTADDVYNFEMGK